MNEYYQVAHQSRAQVVYSNRRYVETVYHYLSFAGFDLKKVLVERLGLVNVAHTNLMILVASVDLPLPEISVRRICDIVDRHLPVRPRSPTRSPAFNVKDMPFKTAGNSGAYLTCRSSITRRSFTLELEGQ